VNEKVKALLRRIVFQLRDALEGDEFALEDLQDALASSDVSAEELAAAFDAILSLTESSREELPDAEAGSRRRGPGEQPVQRRRRGGGVGLGLHHGQPGLEARGGDGLAVHLGHHRIGARGGRSMTRWSAGSTPSARAGPESVSRLIQRIWVARSGTTTAEPASGASPMVPASTTPRKTTSTAGTR